MLGDRIRRRRLELGLSQQQLAGKEMSRAFISLVESNKCTPSSETLRIIAQRLGKPVEYFLQPDNPVDEELDLVMLLIESAERELDKQEPEAVAAAQRKLKQALRRISGRESCREMEARARDLLVGSLLKLNRFEEALEEAEQAVDCYKALNDARALARVYCNLGVAAYKLEDYPRARTAFEQAALYSSGLKSLQSFRATVLGYLGSTLHRLGQYEESLERYREAIEECPPQESPAQWGSIAMGLGCVLFRTGSTDDAFHWTSKALDALRKAKHPYQVLALHNLSVMEAERQNWETAYAGFQACLQAYREQGNVEAQASVLEEIAGYWLRKGDIGRAEATCWEAIDLLDLKDDGILRGRLYRMLGRLALERGDLKQAHSMLRVSWEILRRLRSEAEADASREELQRVRKMKAAADRPHLASSSIYSESASER